MGANFHPHLHGLVSKGAFDAAGMICLPFIAPHVAFSPLSLLRAEFWPFVYRPLPVRGGFGGFVAGSTLLKTHGGFGGFMTGSTIPCQ